MQSSKAGREAIDMRAKAFVDARTRGLPLPVYPGSKPESLDEAYAIQNQAIASFPDTLTGWKVGGINGSWRDTLGTSRLVGPVFAEYTHDYEGETLDMPVFGSGFAAVEGEVTAVIGQDVPAGKEQFSLEEALEYVASFHVGIEIASSPFPEINDHGPLVTISDFGNNRGLILGKEIENWQAFSLDDWTFQTEINGRVVGSGIPDGMPGGPMESVRYALENTAARGHPVRAGMKILTGAVTGVHQAYAGDEACVRFGADYHIRCRLTRFMG